jgi:hypothetical protein
MSNDKQNPIQFLADKLINGKPFTTRDLSYYLAEAEAMYKDAIELAIIVSFNFRQELLIAPTNNRSLGLLQLLHLAQIAVLVLF